MDKHGNPPAINSKSAADEQSAAVLTFLHSFSLSDVPDKVVTHSRYLMLDLQEVAAAGSQTKTANIICDYAAGFMGAGKKQPAVPILFDGRGVSTAGAALLKQACLAPASEGLESDWQQLLFAL